MFSNETNKGRFNAATIRVAGFVLAGLIASAPLCAQEAEEGKGSPSKEQIMAEITYRKAMDKLMPLSKEQVEQVRQSRQEYSSAWQRNSAELEIKTQRATLGAAPIEVHLVPGFVSTLLVRDATGVGWPITHVTVGDPESFNVTQPEVKPGNMITVSTTKSVGSSNLVVTVEGKDMPLIIHLRVAEAQTGSAEEGILSDGLRVIQIDSRSPYAKPPVIGVARVSQVSKETVDILDGVIPAEASRVALEQSISGVSVYEMAGKYFLRTRYPLVWPAWISGPIKGSGDNMVYEIPKVSSLIVLRDQEDLVLDISDEVI